MEDKIANSDRTARRSRDYCGMGDLFGHHGETARGGGRLVLSPICYLLSDDRFSRLTLFQLRSSLPVTDSSYERRSRSM
jgi:hypothetical protein